MTVRANEFSHLVAVDRIPRAGMALRLAAGADARAALARRFGLLALDRLEGEVTLARAGRGIDLAGTLVAEATQVCVVSGEPVAASLSEVLALRFEPPADVAPDTEIELSDEALDLLPIEDGAIDVGEALAQSLAVALDPYPRASPDAVAEARRRLLSEEEAAAEARRSSPFAALRAM